MTPRLVATSALLVLGILILIGATYQGVATALERRRYPHPGKLVDVGGHQLHISCMGQGLPTVVLEAPAASMSGVWGWVQADVAKTTRVCSYDRAGLGWSEAGDRPYDPGRVPEELHRLLAAALEPGPYVLAGHSLGAAFIRRFAGLYPADTAALVLISESDRGEASPRFFVLSPWLARTGVVRATRLFSPGWRGLPPTSADVVSAFLHRPDHLTRASREVARRNDAVRLGHEAAVPAGIVISTLNASLKDETEARKATTAIVAVVRKLRGARKTVASARQQETHLLLFFDPSFIRSATVSG
jgi:pimeloyl-ACP methyl ester carboxylesterase